MPDPDPIIVPIYSYYAEGPYRYEYRDHPDLRQGWTRIGIAFFAFGKDQPDVVPVYQYYAQHPRADGWRSMYSTNPDERVGPDWHRGEIAFYAFKGYRSGTIPVFKHFAVNPWRFMYSTDALSDPVWTIDGVAFYVFATRPPA
jgi:hypothetical protein